MHQRLVRAPRMWSPQVFLHLSWRIVRPTVAHQMPPMQSTALETQFPGQWLQTWRKTSYNHDDHLQLILVRLLGIDLKHFRSTVQRQIQKSFAVNCHTISNEFWRLTIHFEIGKNTLKCWKYNIVYYVLYFLKLHLLSLSVLTLPTLPVSPS